MVKKTTTRINIFQFMSIINNICIECRQLTRNMEIDCTHLRIISGGKQQEIRSGAILKYINI